MLRSHHSRLLAIAKNYTNFKALRKKSGSRKQVHLWQVSLASQLQYYLVKILEDNAFFTRPKTRPRILIFSSFTNNENLQNFKGKTHSLVHRISRRIIPKKNPTVVLVVRVPSVVGEPLQFT